MADNIFQVLLRVAVDENSYNGVSEALKTVDAGVAKISAEFRQMSGFAKSAAAGLSEGFRDVKTEITNVVTGTTEVERRLDELSKKQITPQIKVQTSDEAISQIDDFFGSLPAHARGTRERNKLQSIGFGIRQLPSVPIPGAGFGTDTIGNIVRMTGSLTDFASKTQLVTSATAALTPILGSTAAGFVALAIPIAAVAVPLAALVLILKSISDAADEAAKAEKKYVEALNVQIKTDREIADFISSGDLEGAKKRYKELLDAQQDANAKLTYLYVEKAKIDQEYNNLGGQLNLNARSSIAARGKVIQDEIDKTYNESFVPATQAAEEFAKGMGKVEDASHKVGKAEEELLKKRQDAAEKLQELKDKEAELLANQADEENRINGERNLRKFREQEDHDLQEQRQAEDHQARLTKIETEGQAAVEAKRQANKERLDQADDQIQKLYDSLSDINAKAKDKEDKYNRDFYLDQQDKREDHNKKLNDIEDKSAKERAKILADLALDLRDAEVANDVIAYVAAKKRAEQQLSELDQNNSDARDAENERFADEQDKRQRVHDQRIADIEAEAAAARAQVIENINAKQQERDALKLKLDEELQDAIAKIEAQKQAENDSFALQQKRQDEDRALRLKRQQEDDAIADNRREQQNQKAIDAIQKQIDTQAGTFAIIDAAWKNGANGIATFITSTIGSAISKLSSQVSGLGNSNLTGINAYGGVGSKPYGPFASGSSPFSFSFGGTSKPYSGGLGIGSGVSFAPGGVATQPTFAMVGDVRPDEAEAMIPFRKAEGIGPAIDRLNLGGTSGKGETYIVNLNGDIGNVSEEFLRSELTKSMQAVALGLKKAKQAP